MCCGNFIVSTGNREFSVDDLNGNEILVLSRGPMVLLCKAGDSYRLPVAREMATMLSGESCLLCTGQLDGVSCCGMELPRDLDAFPEGFELVTARSAFLWANAGLVVAISRTRELVSWRNGHRYCGRCQKELHFSGHDLALECDCGMKYYPQIAPAVIVAISRHEGQELLLAHNRNFETGIYGLIAGFVEAGETLEQAVSREIREETSIEVKNIHYLYSQPWPFPNSLMLAFTAEYASGEAQADGTELSDLGWFDREHLPLLPRGGSVARRVIEGFISESLPS